MPRRSRPRTGVPSAPWSIRRSTCWRSRPGACGKRPPPDLLNGILQTWFGPEDEIYEVLGVSTDAVVDRRRVVYRSRVRNGGHDYVCEQTVYYDEVNDRITMLRLLCSGLVPSGVERRTNDSERRANDSGFHN